jgi:hypothetical protein
LTIALTCEGKEKEVLNLNKYEAPEIRDRKCHKRSQGETWLTYCHWQVTPTFLSCLCSIVSTLKFSGCLWFQNSSLTFCQRESLNLKDISYNRLGRLCVFQGPKRLKLPLMTLQSTPRFATWTLLLHTSILTSVYICILS